MNIVRFNDPIQRVFDAYPMREYIGQFRGWQTAPLFDYQTTFEHEKAEMAQLMNGAGLQIEEMPWPFELFRLALSETAVPWEDDVFGTIGEGRYATNYVVSRLTGKMIVLVQIKQMWDAKAVGAVDMRSVREKMMFMLTDVEREDKYTFRFSFSMNLDGRWIEVTPLIHEACQTMVGAAVTGLATFLVDALAPTSHIATVRPDQPTRSVEWLRARTHYTIVAHGHPANKTGILERECVESDRVTELKRMAHNRRAHYRVLRSERFRYARGRRVFIRSTWVGPREWRDQGGKQIYRILEPV